MFGDGLHGLEAVGAFRQYVDVRDGLDVLAQEMPCELLVVDDDRSNVPTAFGTRSGWISRGRALPARIPLQILEIDHHVARGLVAALAVFLQAFANGSLQFTWHFVIEARDGIGLRMQDARHGLGSVRSPERKPSG